MGNGSVKLIHCFSGDTRRCHVTTAVMSKPYDKGLGHSFCYIRPDALATASTTFSKVHRSEETTTFRTIFDASISANTTTSLSTAFADLAWPLATATTFESSTSFSSVPLQLVPRFSSNPLILTDPGLLLGPIERGFMFDPLDQCALPVASPRVALMASPFVTAHTAPLLPSSTAPSPGRRPPTPPCTQPPSSAHLHPPLQ